MERLRSKSTVSDLDPLPEGLCFLSPGCPFHIRRDFQSWNQRMTASEAQAIRRKTRSTKVIDLVWSSPMVRR